MAPTALRDEEALERTGQLVDFLGRIADAAARTPLRDISSGSTAPDPLIWLDGLPVDVETTLDVSGVEPLVRIRPVRSVAPPAPPPVILALVELDTIGDVDREPALDSREGPIGGTRTEVDAAFEDRLTLWRAWAADERVRMARRDVYEQLETIAKTLEQRTTSTSV